MIVIFYFRIHDFAFTADIVIQWKTLRLDPSSLHTRARGQGFASYARVPAPPNRRPYSLDSAGGLSSENPTWPATVGMARYHLLWSHIPTPFTSVFNNYRLALNWADMLERPEDIDIMAIDTYNVPPGQL